MENGTGLKVGIVTGAGQGLGAVIAQTLAAAGVYVAINDINPDRAERTAVAIREQGGTAIAVAADVANKFQCAHLIETTRAEWGQLDILVNNAAIMPRSTILKLDEWEWNRCLEVNLKGTFFMSQLCGRVMADENQERGGVIINIASTAGVNLPLENRAPARRGWWALPANVPANMPSTASVFILCCQMRDGRLPYTSSPKPCARSATSPAMNLFTSPPLTRKILNGA